MFETKDYNLGIVIPYINCADYVIDLVNSIQSHQRHYIILIDNHSDNATKEKLEFLSKRPNIELAVQDHNIGCAGAWNYGMRYLFKNPKINHIAILNNDILLHPDCLDRLYYKQLSSGLPLISAIDMAKECDEPHDIFKLPIPEKETLSENPEFSCFMISRKAFCTIGAFDEKFYPAYFEDNDYHYRIKLSKQRAVKLNTAMYYHFGSRTMKDNEAIGNIVNTYYLQNERYYIEKWGGKPGKEKNAIPFMGRRWG